jgi:hypothetical protein
VHQQQPAVREVEAPSPQRGHLVERVDVGLDELHPTHIQRIERRTRLGENCRTCVETDDPPARPDELGQDR